MVSYESVTMQCSRARTELRVTVVGVSRTHSFRVRSQGLSSLRIFLQSIRYLRDYSLTHWTKKRRKNL